MPGRPRLDAPGAVNHVMGRGIGGRKIIRRDADRKGFLTRLGELCREGSLVVFAWALMENHLLVRPGHQPLGRRQRKISRGRRLSCQLVVGKMGYPRAGVGRFLGVTASAAVQAAYSEELSELPKYL